MQTRDPVAFYALGAQIIPVLLVIVALERRFFKPAPWHSKGMRAYDLLGSMAGLGLFGWAEFGALHAVDVGHGSQWEHVNVVCALIVEGVLIALLALGWTPRSEMDRWKKQTQPDEDDNAE
jgi:hypothetical protein